MKATLHTCWVGLRARVGALVFDTLLVAYALWAAARLWPGGDVQGSWLVGHPGLLLVAPLVASLYEVTGGSLGQRGHGVSLLALSGKAASLARRAWWAYASGTQALLVLLPLAYWGITTLSVGLSLGIALLVGSATLLLRLPCSLPEALAGVRVAPPRADPDLDLVPWYERLNAWVLVLVLGLTLALGAQMTEFSPGALAGGAERTKALWNHLLSPDWSITSRVIDLLVETIFLALMASVLALPFAFGLSFLGARNVMSGSWAQRLVYVLARVLMNITRSIEPLVWAIIFVLWVGIGPFAGMLALWVHSIASLAKLYSEAIENIEPGPVEAIEATGARTLQVLRYGVLPQVLAPFLAFTVYRWDINVRMATILGLVGGGGIGDLLINYQQLGAWSKVGTIIVFITLVVWLLDIASSRARQRLV